MPTPLLITAAICGAEVTRADTPHVPYSPAELADEALRCFEAGAHVVHLHVREADGTPSQRAELFGEAMASIRARSTMIVQFSTGGAVGMSVQERADAVSLGPDMATLTTGSVNFGDEVFLNPPAGIRAIARRLQTYGVRPEIECFDSGMVDFALRLSAEGLIDLPAHFNFVLGCPGAMGATPAHLDFMRSLIPSNCTWSVAGIGRHELPLAERAIALGGHVRVGLEDNIYLRKGVLAKGSSELVAHVATLAQQAGRRLASMAEARILLRLG